MLLFFSWWHLFFVEKCYLVLVLRINTHWCIYICTTFIIWFCGKNIEQKNKGLGRQVTGHRPGHRSGHRSDHRSHPKTIGHWTKLFLIDILLYKNKTSQGTSIIFFLFWTLPNPTHEKIYSCWSRKEDLRYSVTKVGNEITKVRKITWFVRKNESQNEGLLR